MIDIFTLINAAIWKKPIKGAITQDTYCQLKQHALLPLFVNIIKDLQMPLEMKAAWKKSIYANLVHYSACLSVQNTLPLSVPYNILKGSAVGQYYPSPEIRTYGDIDIIVLRQDFDNACQQLVNAGFRLTKDLEREKGFVKNGVEVELHRYFAALNDPLCSQYLDDLILDNINDTHLLPDLINGLTILEHISQHLENGLGLRQIVDWMMFVDQCLPDSKWQSFEQLADRIGLKNLAITITRMCELYFGLSIHSFCRSAEEQLCKQLMDYVLTCGNFGNNRNDLSISANVFSNMRNPISVIALLQQRGIANWEAARKRKYLQPFAWLYQGCRYITKAIHSGITGHVLLSAYSEGRSRKTLFDKLGVKQSSKGNVVYHNGRYVKRIRH